VSNLCVRLIALGLLIARPVGAADQEPAASSSASILKVVFLGTGGGPLINAERAGISTLVVAGPEMLLFDCGRNATTALARLAINPADVTKVFLTHLHSDHIVSLPELYLFPWASEGRSSPLRIWGPSGTRSMMNHLEKAFEFDIHVRRDLDERYPAEGIKTVVSEIREGVVYEANGARVTAFLVDHGPVKPAFGYRIEYRGRSVVISGDTRPTDNLIAFSRGADVLIHELARFKQDPLLKGPADEILPNTRQTRRQWRTIADHHTDGLEAGRIFAQVKPKLAIFSHANPPPAATLPLVRQNYAGAVEYAEDLMTLEIGDTVTIHRFLPPTR
jgi:ribonuclease Z